MKIITPILILSICLCPYFLFSQTKTPYTINLSKIENPKSFTNQLDIAIKPIEYPYPDGKKMQYKHAEIKKNQKQRLKNKIPAKKQTLSTSTPTVGQNFGLYRPYIPQLDTSFPIIGGAPLDNTLSISNGGILLTAVNSIIYAHDVSSDSSLFSSSPFINYFSFSQFASKDSISTSYPFDPKTVYDPNRDRFILCFLSGRDQFDSKIVVAFSSSNNPMDPWYLYELPGNPRNISNWTDYPALAISKDDLFLTVNLIIPDSSWQAGFDGSIVWQMDLDQAFAGQNTVNTDLWDQIKYGGKYIRNLHPVSYAMEPHSEEMYFLSNRNFDLQNDTLFIVKINQNIESGNAQITIAMEQLDLPYGMPPNGKQEDTDLNDPSTGLQTNDARWLGGFYLENEIQFVGNTIDWSTTNAGVYHGKIKHLNSPNQSIEGYIVGDSVMDFAYPNIAFTGKAHCETQSVIGFDHSSTQDYAGVSFVYYNNDGLYAPVVRLKEGEGYVDSPPIHNDPYERWGDYFGIQRKYNQPGIVWTAGFYGVKSNNGSIWISEIISPDTTTFALDVVVKEPSFNTCEAEGNMVIQGGNAPFTALVNGNTIEVNTPIELNICDGNYSLLVEDENKCQLYWNKQYTETLHPSQIFPNPFSDHLFLEFTAPNDFASYKLEIVNYMGQLVYSKKSFSGKAGLNRLQLLPQALSSGWYNVAVYDENQKELISKSIVKLESK